VSAELAAARTAAAAVLADFRSAYNRYLGDPVNAPCPDYPVWALRLAQHLQYVLDAPGAEAASFLAAAQLAGVRVVLEAFDWETGDRQYALEQIDAIVSGDGS
jgi:hypothetical protein